MPLVPARKRLGPLVSFVRVDTLDQPDYLPPDIHILTASQQPWLQLPPESLARLQALWPQIEVYRAARRRV